MPLSGSPRGVFKMRPTTRDGHTILWVVTSDNRRIMERVLLPTDDPAHVEEFLHQLLDREDPVKLQALA